MVPSTSRARPGLAGMAITVGWRHAGDPSRERRGGGRHRRRPDPRGRTTGPAERHRAPLRRARPSAGTLSLVAAKASPRVSFYYGVHNPSLRFEIESTPAPERPPHRRHRRRHRGSRAQLLPQRRRAPLPVSIRWDGATAAKRTAPKGHYSFRVGSQAAPRAALHALDFQRTAEPQLRLLRLRLPGPRRTRLRRRRRPVRRQPLRPHSPGPGPDGRLRPAGGRGQRRDGPVRGLGRARPATTWSSTAREPRMTRRTCTSPNRHR